MSKNMDEWRKFFNTAKGDIFQVIENGILVAAFDCPNEFKLRRDRIGEVLFNCRYTQCAGCDRIELAVPAHPSNEDDDEHGHGRAVKANSDDLNKVNSATRGSNFSYDEAEALTEELEEEKRDVDEVLRIREILRNSREESKESLFECLRRLELMGLSVRTLEVTHIGKAVSGLKKHGSLQIREFAKSLVDYRYNNLNHLIMNCSSWKALYTEYYNAREAVKGKSDSPDSVNPPTSNEEEEELGLPSPPLDDFGAFLDVQTTSMELSKFFEGMDEDGNGRRSGEFEKADRNRRKSMPEMRNVEMEGENTEKRKSQPERIETVSAKDRDSHHIVKQETAIKQSKPCNTMPEVRRTPNLRTEHKMSSEMKLQQKPDGGMLAKRSGQQEKSKGTGEVVDERLAAAKKRLQENYQQAENAKKQRTIQVMELSDIPKGKTGFSSRNAQFRPGNHNRQRLINGRH